MFRKMQNNYYPMPLWSSNPFFYPRPTIPMPSNPPIVPSVPDTGAPDFEFEPGPPVQQDTSYTQGWLATQIGKYVKIEFLIGTSMLIDREGVLVEVGISYVVIRESGTNDLLMCDIYSIKFVRVFKDSTGPRE